MSGYKRDIVMRIVPINGSETVYWFDEELTDLGSHVRCTPTYPRTIVMREDINRVMRPVVHATRCSIEIEVLIASMADQWFLQDIENALDDPLNCSVFLSLDGGVVEREVVRLNTDGVNPQPIRGKTVVGATFVLSLQTKAPIGPRGAMMTDPGIGAELIQDGGLEQWETTAQPQAWSTTAGIITVARESTTKRSGTYAAKVTRSDGGTAGLFQARSSDQHFKIKRNAWYRLQAYAKGSKIMQATASGPFRVQIMNASATEQILPGGKTAGASPDFLAPKTVIFGTWAFQEGYFRLPPTWNENDSMFVRFAGYWDQNESLFYDDISVYGPVLRPGYATW